MNVYEVLVEAGITAERLWEDPMQGLILIWVDGMHAPLLGWVEVADGVMTTFREVTPDSRRQHRGDPKPSDFPWHIQTDRIFAIRYATREDIR